MRHACLPKFSPIAILAIVLAVSGLFSSEAKAEGGIRLRQPFDGTYRLTAYVDHRSPNYTYDGNVVVYNGEERLNCPDCGESWTNQGPYCYDGHNATDYALPGNTPVLAVASGRVTFRGWRSTYYGDSIRIDHGNGYETWYSHLASFSVNLNDIVTAGQQIGLSGNTGQNKPYHLHFEVRRNGYVTDPFGWRGDWADPLSGGPAVCLWGDGKCFEIVMEDESDWFNRYGTGWDWDCHGNGWTMRRVANRRTSESVYARWRPYLPYRGIYAVYAFIPAIHATTTNAEYIVQDRYHTRIIPISQLDFSNEWVYLGTYDFWEGNLGSVKLNNVTGEADQSREVCFDSVRFRQFRIFIPIVSFQ